MRAPLTRLLALAALVVAPAMSPAQSTMIELDGARRAFVEKQYRQAAYFLRIASSALRSEIGRCHDETIGAALIEAEPRLDRLAQRVSSGSVTSVDQLDREFAAVDRLMAQHHQALAAENWEKPKIVPLATVGRDLGYAADYLVRSSRWDGVTLAPAALQAVTDARGLAKALATATATERPANGATVIEALGKAIADRVAASQVSQ